MNFFWDDGLVQEFFFLRIFTCRIFFFQNHPPPSPPPKVKWLAPKQRRSPKESGCLPFNQKIRKFRFEVKWKGNFPENIFGNCGQPPEVVLFFRSERNPQNALTICENPTVSRPFLTKSLAFMQRSFHPDYLAKW